MTLPRFLLVLLSIFSLASCIPAVIGTATVGGVSIAEDRTTGQEVDDATIWTKIKNDLFQKNIDLVGRVGIEVNEGRVLLTGNVPNSQVQLDVVKIAWNEPGVKEVINELKVANPSAPEVIEDYSRDSWITTQVKSRMLIDTNIKSVNYTVVTINRVVYLMGSAQNKDELNRVTDIASTVSYVQKVVSYVHIKNTPPAPPPHTGYTAH